METRNTGLKILLLFVMLLAACSPTTPEPVTVKETVVSEIPVSVEVTRVVEVTSEPVASGTEATTTSTEVVEKTVEGEKDRVGERIEMPDLHDGKGMTLIYSFFQGELDPSSAAFFDFILKPGTYVGYHRHEGNMEIHYILSGKAEYFQDGKREVLEAGDAMLVKSGESHAVRNIGDEDLHGLGFFVAPKDDIGIIVDLPLPKQVSDWDQGP
jgi:quercetin dioxygenase-like cupin family protein